MTGIKIRIILFFLLALTVNPATFAKTGAGIQGGAAFTPKVNDYYDLSAGMTLRSDYTPWGLYAGWNFREKSLTVILDNWWIYRNLNSRVNWFAFWGMSFSGRFENTFFADTGARVGIGLNAFLFDSRSLELYAHGAWNPSIGAACNRECRKYSLRFVPACFPVNAGIRVWM